MIVVSSTAKSQKLVSCNRHGLTSMTSSPPNASFASRTQWRHIAVATTTTTLATVCIVLSHNAGQLNSCSIDEKMQF
jgi:hypothetical protein